ncbi:hypothetical protein SAMN06265370_13913 [Puniceibacterium sediminis]|uniref:Uncharacterized protein n=1 Tax=Puniceibacterium sediminis TaxID=1608407 RepID=A0A238ZS26_9RHOB|nr:hypothetical protein SAMN06265370_13913 [Puniceibacterium sediminis]
MGLKRTDEFGQDAGRIALSSGLTRKQVADNLGVGDLPSAGPSFITRVCWFQTGGVVGRFGQARRARSRQIAQASGALRAACGSRAMSVA